MLIGLAAAVAVAYGLDYMNDTIKTPEDVTRHLKMAFLGLVPSVRGNKHPILGSVHSPHDFGEAFRSLRTSLNARYSDTTTRTMLVTSAQPLEGKTTTACNIAMALAYGGARVLLVDADMRTSRTASAAATQQRPRPVAGPERSGARSRRHSAHGRSQSAGDHGRHAAAQSVRAAGVGADEDAAHQLSARSVRLDRHRHAAGAGRHRCRRARTAGVGRHLRRRRRDDATPPGGTRARDRALESSRSMSASSSTRSISRRTSTTTPATTAISTRTTTQKRSEGRGRAAGAGRARRLVAVRLRRRLPLDSRPARRRGCRHRVAATPTPPRETYRPVDGLLLASLVSASGSSCPLPAGVRDLLSPAAAGVRPLARPGLDRRVSARAPAVAGSRARRRGLSAIAIDDACSCSGPPARRSNVAASAGWCEGVAWCGLTLASLVFVQRVVQPASYLRLLDADHADAAPTPLGPFVNRNDLADLAAAGDPAGHRLRAWHASLQHGRRSSRLRRHRVYR